MKCCVCVILSRCVLVAMRSCEQEGEVEVKLCREGKEKVDEKPNERKNPRKRQRRAHFPLFFSPVHPARTTLLVDSINTACSPSREKKKKKGFATKAVLCASLHPSFRASVTGPTTWTSDSGASTPLNNTKHQHQHTLSRCVPARRREARFPGDDGREEWDEKKKNEALT